MSKAKPKTQTVINQNTIIKGIDYDLLADAIVKAQIKASESVKTLEDEMAEAAASKWHNTLGIKSIDNDWNPIKKLVYSFRNSIVGIWRLLWLRRDDTYKDTATVALLNSMATWVIEGFKLIAYFGSFTLIVFAIRSAYTSKWILAAGAIIISASAFLVARLLRIVQFEIEKTQDSQYLIGFLSALLAIIALAVSVVTWLFPR